MKSNYKKLGSYIREVNIRNTEDKKDNLLGVSTQKVFIKSIANTVGTNFKKYKIVKKGQFTYVPDTSRRGDRIGLALLEDHEEALVSNVYTVFEIIDHNQLLPEYLMMWFRRPEFDRYARYKSHGSVRELFGWDEMCDVELPIPHIEKQREIVKEYQTIVDRIKLNEKLNQKLEETAQAIYKQWFVDFEFPISKEYAAKIGNPELEGKPYKSSGGKMVWNEKLEEEIPEEWGAIPLYNTAQFTNGGAFKDKDFSRNQMGLPIIKIAELKLGVTNQTSFTEKSAPNKIHISTGTILYSWSGNPQTSLEVFKWLRGDAILNQHIFKLSFGKSQNSKFVYFLLKELKPVFIKLAEGKQTTGLGHITVADMKSLFIAYPISSDLKSFDEIISPIYEIDTQRQKENIKLSEMIEMLLSKMTKAEATP